MNWNSQFDYEWCTTPTLTHCFFVSVFYLAQAPWQGPLEDLDNATHYSVPELTRLTALKKGCKLVS